MAWIIGMASQPEIDGLARRGWDVEDLSLKHLTDLLAQGEATDKMVVVYVDNDLFAIMTGPDWSRPVILTFDKLKVGARFVIPSHVEPRDVFIKAPDCRQPDFDQEANCIRLCTDGKSVMSVISLFEIVELDLTPST